MCCRLCRSRNQKAFYSEINIHFPGINQLTRTVWAFPTLLVCLDCGFTELTIEEAALRSLEEARGAEGAAA
jgi:hypothetical protein